LAPELGGWALRTIAVIALKGGSGKTTVATHLALAAYLRGLDVLVADSDPQGSAKDVLGMREGEGPQCVPTPTGPKLLAAQFDAARRQRDLLIVDTTAAVIDDVGEAVVLSDLCILVVRPTMLDLTGLVRTLLLVRKMRKPAVVVMNQAPVPRESVEAPVVKRMRRGLDYMRAPMAPMVLRQRSAYQTSLERGRSVEETHDPAAAKEVSALWSFVQRLLGGLPKPMEYAYPFEDDDDVETPVYADRPPVPSEEHFAIAAL
jgi:chromosome partitioning protein